MSIIKILRRGTHSLASVVDTFVVEWTRRYGKYHGETEQCFQAFTSKKEADEFADSIRRAHKLIGNTCDNKVSVSKNKCGIIK